MPLPWLQHLKIPFQDIKSLTDNFHERNKIGEGGFGNVYKGEHSKHGTVAIKRLESKWEQGTVEFLNEITILSRYRHENLISLVGFCDDNGEMIIVYKYALNESLDKWLSEKSLTWMQRLKICVGVARGLHYLHTCPGHQQRIIHRDIKSANILLNEKWEAKISDFGLSKLGPKDQEQSFVIAAAAGTRGYCDPQYEKTFLLRKESDVFSFGVVLLEVLCGRINSKDDELVPSARTCFELGEPDKLVDETLLEQIETKCLNTFAAIAYKCVSQSHETRPPMHNVVGELEKALRFQEPMKGPMPQVTVAFIQCEKILEESFSSFVANEDWIKLEEAARSHQASGFRKRLGLLIQKCLIDYDKGTAYLEEGVRSEKRKQLEEKMQLHVQSKLMLAHSLSGKLDMFKKEFYNALKEGKLFAAAARDCTKLSIKEFDRECTDIMLGQANSDSAIDKARNKLRCCMEEHITQVRVVKLSELTREYELKIDEALRKPVKDMLNGCGDHTWPGIRKVLQQVTETDVKWFLHALSAFEIDEKTKVEMRSGLSDYAIQVIESTARAEARPERVLQLMVSMMIDMWKEGTQGDVSMGKDNTKLIKTINHKNLKLLSINAAIQLEDGVDDYIWNTLKGALLNNKDGDKLNSHTWEKVRTSWTLISPAECKNLWKEGETKICDSHKKAANDQCNII